MTYNVLLKVLKVKFIMLIIFAMNFSVHVSAQRLVVGYYPDYGSGIVPTEEIQFENLTHIVHGFVWPNSDGSLSMYEGIQTSNFVTLAHQAGIKVMLALGGAGDTPTLGFEVIAGDSTKRAAFVNNSVNLSISLGYDGIDLDWEFPDNAGERSNYTLLVKEFRKALNDIDSSLLLTMAASSTGFFGQWTEYEKIVDDMDWFNLLAYEYSGAWIKETRHNAPLHKWQNITGENGEESVKYMNVTRKIPKDKIVLGIPFYGKMYASSGLNQAWDSLTTENPVLGLTYRDVLNNINDSYTYNFDEEAKVPYYISLSENRFISFDDTTSVKIKTEYAINSGLKGVMIWEITQDKLSDNSQPLLEQIGRTIKSTPTSISNEAILVQNDYHLYNNYPNPFNPTTKIKFSIPNPGFVSLKVFNSLGQEVGEILKEYLNEGSYEKVFDAKDLSSGIYFYSLIAGGTIITNKMILLK